MENLAMTTPTTNSSSVLTVKEVAQKLRVHDTTVRHWIEKGALKAIRLPGGVYRIKENTLQHLLGE